MTVSTHRQPTDYRQGIYRRALLDAVRKLNPRVMLRNPVMFVVEVGSMLTTLFWLLALAGASQRTGRFYRRRDSLALVYLALCQLCRSSGRRAGQSAGRGTAQNATRDPAKKLARAGRNAGYETVASTQLRQGDVVLVEAGDVIPTDGEVVAGIASVDESAVTGESAPVIRESGGDRSAVTGGTRVLSDWLAVRVTANPGEGFLDRMISLVEGAARQKTPNEIALTIVLASFTIVFLIVVATLLPLSLFSVRVAGGGQPVTLTVLIALLVCLIPTTIGGLLSAIGIAGMDRLIRRNVIAMSGRAVEAAGDVTSLLLDKTGTITLGNRQAVDFIPVNGVEPKRLAELAQLSSLADETPEGRSIVVLAKEKYGLRGRSVGAHDDVPEGAHFIPFTAQTRMSGVNVNGYQIRKGAARRCPRPNPLCGQAGTAGTRAAWSSRLPAAAARRWWSPTTTKRLGSSTSKM